MLVSEFVTLVWLKYRGKGSDKAPAAGTQKWLNIVAHANNKIQHKWAKDPDQQWQSLFRIDTFTASTALTYDLDDDVEKLSDEVVITTSEDAEKKYTTVPPALRHKYPNTCYVSGSGPKALTFTEDIPEDYVGGTISVPLYFIPPKLTSASDVIPVDNQNWLVCEVAGELANADVAQRRKYPDLVKESDTEYAKMVRANQNTPYGQPNEATYDMTNMGGMC